MRPAPDLDLLQPTEPDAVNWSAVRSLTVVCYLPDQQLIMVQTPGGYVLPTGPVEPGEDVLLDTVLRIPLQVAGFRRQGTHLVAATADSSGLLYWVDGSRYFGDRPHNADADWWTGDARAAAALLRDQGDGDWADAVELADRHRRTITDEQLAADSRRLLDRAYLQAGTAEGGSGFGRSPADWRADREHVCDAITADQTFLDVGCANGLLMESVVAWSAERGLQVEPYGIDHSPGLVRLARHRLPRWQDRLWVGDALSWHHPGGRRFDVVAVMPEVVPGHRQREMIIHLLNDVVSPGGRLLLSSYSGAAELAGAAVLSRNGFRVDGETRLPARGRPDSRRSAWVENRG